MTILSEELLLSDPTFYSLLLWNRDNPFRAKYDRNTRSVLCDGKSYSVEEFYSGRLPEGWDADVRSREAYFALLLKSIDLEYAQNG